MIKKQLLFCILLVSFHVSAQRESFKSFEENEPDSAGSWSYHFQFTTVYQGHPSFHSLYNGAKSFKSESEEALSVTSTIFFGRKLWENAAIYFNPELAGGTGLSGVNGMGGVFNGEIYRVGSPSPVPYIARMYFQQHIPLHGSSKEYLQNDLNQVREAAPASRITISMGKFSMPDFFDHNLYAHDPRTKFLNWSLMSGIAWDYPADVRGYTWGIVTELIQPGWEVRVSSALVPLVPNGMWLDWNYAKAHSETFEIEKKLMICKHTGKIRLLLFHTVSKAPAYADAISRIKNGDLSLVGIIKGDSQWGQYGGQKYGMSVSVNQEIIKGVGVFARYSWNDGKYATWIFSEVDASSSIGAEINGLYWKRKNDQLGIAIAMNELSTDHKNYLNAGGYGFMLGDGKLTNYGPERIFETYYSVGITSSLWFTLDYQFAANVGYNRDRGPVHVIGIRTHIEF